VALVLLALGPDPARIAVFVALGLFALFAAIAYTVGKHAYGYFGLADLFCLACFGLLAVCGGYYLYAHTITIAVLAAGFGIGLLVCGMLNLNNMRDRETDAKAGKSTLAVRLGRGGARVYHSLLVVLGLLSLIGASLALGAGAGTWEWWRFVYLLAFVAFALHLLAVGRVRDAAAYDKLMRPYSLCVILVSVLFAISVGV
jgi:1,4-dihydroxy-2-naphthoate octaprenyltransferase